MNEQFLYQKLDILKEADTLKDLPTIIEKCLSEKILLREYQKDAFQYFITYFENNKLRNNKQLHTLFHMATGSGKTVIMAGLILYLFTKGYNNFIFFVNQTNIIEKTKENFLNELSNKYLFNKDIYYLEEKIKIKMVNNFQNSFLEDKSINICFTTIQKLYNDLFENKENSITFADFEDNNVVFISDESHHMNATTKKKLNKTEKIELESWENSVMKAFKKNRDSIFLEFTATLNLKDKNIKNKYIDKIIFNYPLKNFRDSLYTKEFENITTVADPWNRTLIALILSEYRKYLFADLKLNIKPVLLLKSKSISDSREFYEEFLEKIKFLNVEDLEKISNETNIEILKKTFQYFKGKNEDLTFLVHSIKDSFQEENLLLINSQTIPKGIQLLINSLEDEENPIRAVFAVDMLNEGWDVLNLYDIVRLYENRGENYTTKEAQLIGRAARYCPFKLNDEQEKYKRKYDEDIENTYRVLETMYFHSKNDSKYISELREALIKIGMKDPKEKIKREYKLKESFKEQPVYKNSFIYLNERIEKDRKNICGIDEKIKNETHSYYIQSIKGKSVNLFIEDNKKFQKEVQDTPNIISKKLSEIDYHILLGASECFTELKFNVIKQKFPNLKSTREFLLSPSYLGDIKIEFYSQNLLTELKGKDYFEAAKKVFRKIADYIISIKSEYEGTKIFIPHKMNEIIKDKSIYLSEIKENGGKGESQIFSSNPDLKLNLELEPWYVFNDNYGTSEEKAFIKYFKTDIAPKLDEKGLEYYVIRNERELAIYSFKDGNRFEPDYLLFIRKKKISKDVIDYQVFIEPKGNQFLGEDIWKEIFLEKIQDFSKLKRDSSKNLELIKDEDHFLIGFPFFNREHRNKEFSEAIQKFLAEL